MMVKKTDWNLITLPHEIAQQFIDVEYFEVRAAADRILIEPYRGDPQEQLREEVKEWGVSEDELRELARALQERQEG